MKTRMLIIAVVLAVGASAAMADITGPATVVESGSWTFVGPGYYHYLPWNTYVLTLTGDTFNAPYAVLSGAGGTWTLDLGMSTSTLLVYHSSTPVSGYAVVGLTVYGAGTANSSNTMEFIAYNDTTWIGTDAYHTNGAYLGCDERRADGSVELGYGRGVIEFPQVPAPAALVLGAIGLGLVGWMKKRIG